MLDQEPGGSTEVPTIPQSGLSEFEGVKALVMLFRTAQFLCGTIIVTLPAPSATVGTSLVAFLPLSFFSPSKNDAVDDAALNEPSSNKHVYTRRNSDNSPTSVSRAYCCAAGCLAIDVAGWLLTPYN
jgi:hypothetical protein